MSHIISSICVALHGITFILAISCGGPVHAQDAASVSAEKRLVLSQFYWADGLLEMYATPSLLNQVPKWSNHLEPPPVACHEAITIATKWLDANKASDGSGAAAYRFLTATLWSFERKHWCWQISFVRRSEGNATTGVPAVLPISVLMNHTVAQTRPVPRELSMTVPVAEFESYPKEVQVHFTKGEVRDGKIQLTMYYELFQALPVEHHRLLPKRFVDEWRVENTGHAVRMLLER